MEATILYGPVRSWRFGRSLGVDLILNESTCSFDCIYCQLGRIQRVTARQQVFVPTERFAAELDSVDWDGVDVVTFSGSGEPTLALNIGEAIDLVRQRGKRVMVLTNATLLTDPATRARLAHADTVACKLDAATPATLEKMNRPAEGITHEGIIAGIRAMRESDYAGTLAIQSMFMPTNLHEAEAIARLIATLRPDEIHLNTPTRPYPRTWYQGARGNHEGPAPVPEAHLKTISMDEARVVEALIRQYNPGARILSIYREAPTA
jgi:wyosine [tRNA(Phe)-imidazoG37] synthetase (radical SAM superfamily)